MTTTDSTLTEDLELPEFDEDDDWEPETEALNRWFKTYQLIQEAKNADKELIEQLSATYRRMFAKVRSDIEV